VTKKRRSRNQPKLQKLFCEICKTNDKNVLNIHHIIPRCDERCTNNNHNLAVLCSNCHDLVHTGQITIIGVYNSTGPNGRTLLFYKKGETPPLEKEFWFIQENNKVVTR
jgi:hypothetical protein